MATESSQDLATALVRTLDRLGGDQFEREEILEALLVVLREDRRLCGRIRDTARDLLDDIETHRADGVNLYDLLRP